MTDNLSLKRSTSSVIRGQVLPLKSLNNVVKVELLHEGFKYHLSVTKNGPTQYFLVMNGSHKTVDVFSLSDAGLLISVDGTSYATYLQNEADKWVTLQNDADKWVTLQNEAGK